MKKFDWKKFLKECAVSYFISLGVCALVAVLSHWFIGFNILERYLEGITIMLAITIPMGLVIFGYFGGNIWVRRLILWLFSCPIIVVFTAFIRIDRPMSVQNVINVIVGYTIGLSCSYLIADALERRKLAKINEKLSKNE